LLRLYSRSNQEPLASAHKSKNTLGVQLIKVLAPNVGQARGAAGAEQSPLLVRLNPMHEQIVDPKPIEKVAGARLLLAMVLSKVEPIENVRVPRLKVDGKCTLAFAAALVYVASCVVEYT
jgi:hypothetical protein